MKNLAFCLEMLYRELPFARRLVAAKQDGVTAIEMWDWRDKNIPALRQQLQTLEIRLLNMSGNRRFGMLDDAEEENFIREIRETAQVARTLDCPRLMLLVQRLLQDDRAKPAAAGLSRREKVEQLIRSGRRAGEVGDEFGLEVVIEPLNDVLDHPGYFLNSAQLAFEVISEIGHPRVKLLYDVYHMAMMGENIFRDLEQHISLIGYIHLADKPGRHEPGSGQLDFRGLLALLQHLHYAGPIGFEFTPSDGDSHRAVTQVLRDFAAAAD
ncbi:MAG: hypothetical protein D6743_05225 [Calditrichaeota bacterium]|nr:MAG: hypothetical protein D6743_05225 [Calditrichota bacterium]